MNKFFTKILLPVLTISIIYKWRYRLLNFILSSRSIRQLSIQLAMMIPGVRSRMISSTFQKQ